MLCLLFLFMQRIIILSLLLLLALSSPFTIHRHNVNTGARCLDGSEAALYVSPGDNSQVVIFFDGGGFCGGKSLSATMESCYQRSFTDLGSSKGYKDIITTQGGILSDRNTSNPHFYNWTKVIVPYCDGSFHQGSRRAEMNYKDAALYFRGSNNTLQHFQYLNQTINLFSAERIIVTGTSAGGVAAFIWSNYLIENSVSKNVYSVPDSGLFLSNFANPYTGNYDLMDAAAILVGFVNSETDMPISNCVQQMGSNEACFLINAYPQYFKAPLFIVESEYDQYSLRNILTMSCPTKGSIGSYSLEKCSDTQKGFIQKYRSATLEAFGNFTHSLTNIGFWAPACVQHGFITINNAFTGTSYRVPTGSGPSMSDAIYQFINNVSDKAGNQHIDSVSWPNNSGCSSLSQANHLRNRWFVSQQ